MRNWLLKKLGVRRAQKGQTTAEYAIIVALVAVASISVIMIFGNQIRALIAGEASGLTKTDPDDTVTVEDKTDGVDDHVEKGLDQF